MLPLTLSNIHAPLQFGLDVRRRVMIPLAPDVFAAIEDSAERRELGLGVGPYCARLVRRFFRLDFLSAANIAFLTELRAHLPGMELLDVLNVALTNFRLAVRAGKLTPTFLAAQSQKPEHSGAARNRAAQPLLDVVGERE